MFPIGVGVYWVAGNVFRIFQSVIINIYFKRLDMDEMINKNVDKAKKRYEKMGIDPNKMTPNLQKKPSTTQTKKAEKKTPNASEVTKNKTKNTNYNRPDNKKYKEGSIASYANMLNNRGDSK